MFIDPAATLAGLWRTLCIIMFRNVFLTPKCAGMWVIEVRMQPVAYTKYEPHITSVILQEGVIPTFRDTTYGL